MSRVYITIQEALSFWTIKREATKGGRSRSPRGDGLTRLRDMEGRAIQGAPPY
jgi:hypothetical protein